MGGRHSSLLDAASADDVLAVKKLLADETTDPTQCDPHGWTALHIACFQGLIGVVHEVLSSPHAQSLVNLPDKQGRTPLHLASSQDHAEVVADLLAAGAVGDLRDANKLLPIHKAAYAGAGAVLRLLARQRTHVNDSLHDGMTPLHMAAWQGSVDGINVLLTAGADPLARNNRGGTPLHEAAAAGHLLAVRALLGGPSRGALNLRALGGMRPVDLAAANGHERVVRELKRAEEGGLFNMIGRTVGRTIGLLKEVSGGGRGGGRPAEAQEVEDDWGEEGGLRDWDGELIAPPALLAPPEARAAGGDGTPAQGHADAPPAYQPVRVLPVQHGVEDGDWAPQPNPTEDGWGSPEVSPRASLAASAAIPPVVNGTAAAAKEQSSGTSGALVPATSDQPTIASGRLAPADIAGGQPYQSAMAGDSHEDPGTQWDAKKTPTAAQSGLASDAAPGSADSVLAQREDLLKKQQQEIEALRRQLEQSYISSKGSLRDPLQQMASTWPSCQMYSREELLEATANYGPENLLGQGGFGSVYRGTLRNHTRVAVKRLSTDSMQTSESLWQEVNVLSRIRHPHVVLLLGACPEDSCLVYELMDGGSLEDALCRRNPDLPPLEWQDRVRIAAEMATALLVLHQAQPEPILHRDFKPANVLLDSHLTAKLADVGLARLAPELNSANRTHVQDTSPVGTLDYLDPEYLHTGRFAPASDTYALGVSMLQLLTGRQPRGSDGRTLHDWVAALCRVGMVHDAIDNSAIRKSLWPLQDAKLFAELAVQCCMYSRADRPALVNVVHTLQELAASAHTKAEAAAALEETVVGGQMAQNVPPVMFLCPITQEVMEDPVVAADGFTYERSAIKEWFATGHQTSPMSNAPLPRTQLTPNFVVRSAIQEWAERVSTKQRPAMVS